MNAEWKWQRLFSPTADGAGGAEEVVDESVEEPIEPTEGDEEAKPAAPPRVEDIADTPSQPPSTKKEGGKPSNAEKRIKSLLAKYGDSEKEKAALKEELESLKREQQIRKIQEESRTQPRRFEEPPPPPGRGRFPKRVEELLASNPTHKELVELIEEIALYHVEPLRKEFGTTAEQLQNMGREERRRTFDQMFDEVENELIPTLGPLAEGFPNQRRLRGEVNELTHQIIESEVGYQNLSRQTPGIIRRVYGDAYSRAYKAIQGEYSGYTDHVRQSVGKKAAAAAKAIPAGTGVPAGGVPDALNDLDNRFRNGELSVEEYDEQHKAILRQRNAS
jgi:hypothetical protein